jgi:AcrR family transcriptional regulator
MDSMAKYHHGNLRNVLITSAIALLAEEGVHGLSLRKISQRAGVSHNAPYMHFADKEAVLAAVAEEGFRQLAVQVAGAIAHSEDNTRQRLITVSRTYVNFALSHPHHVQVMFHPTDVAKYPTLVEASQISLNQLFEIVKSGQVKGELIAGDTHSMTKAIWAMVHGVAMILIADRPEDVIAVEKVAIEEKVAIFISFLLDGLAM